MGAHERDRSGGEPVHIAGRGHRLVAVEEVAEVDGHQCDQKDADHRSPQAPADGDNEGEGHHERRPPHDRRQREYRSRCIRHPVEEVPLDLMHRTRRGGDGDHPGHGDDEATRRRDPRTP